MYACTLAYMLASLHLCTSSQLLRLSLAPLHQLPRRCRSPLRPLSLQRHAVQVARRISARMRVCRCMYLCMYVCVDACMYVPMNVCMYVCTYVCMYVCIHIHTSVCVFSEGARHVLEVAPVIRSRSPTLREWGSRGAGAPHGKTARGWLRSFRRGRTETIVPLPRRAAAHRGRLPRKM